MKNEHRTSNIERPTSNKKQIPNTEHSIAISVLTHLTVSVYRVLQMRGVRVRRRTPCTSSARQQSRCGVL